jgi:trimeric autotransporter adhesin
MHRSLPVANLLMILGGMLLTVSAPAMAAASPTFDANGSSKGSSGVFTGSGTTSTSVTISTSSTNDIIYAIVLSGKSNGAPPAPTTGPSGSSLGSFTARCTDTTAALGVSLYTYYTLATGTLSSEVITVTQTTNNLYLGLIVFAVSGADTTTPFDQNLASCPAGATGTSTTPSASATTTGTGDLVVGFVGLLTSGTASSTAGSTRVVETAIVTGNPSTNNYLGDSESTSTSTPGSQSQSFTVSGATSITGWTVGADAFVSTAGLPEFPFGLLPIMLVVPVAYFSLRRRKN